MTSIYRVKFWFPSGDPVSFDKIDTFYRVNQYGNIMTGDFIRSIRKTDPLDTTCPDDSARVVVNGVTIEHKVNASHTVVLALIHKIVSATGPQAEA